ncbi:hypothetical protein ACHAXN_012405 [Cyclotella atomus]
MDSVDHQDGSSQENNEQQLLNSSDDSTSADENIDDNEVELPLNDETDHDEQESQRRDNVRQQYRRRLTLDPLAEFILDEELQRLAEQDLNDGDANEDAMNDANDEADDEARDSESDDDGLMHFLLEQHVYRSDDHDAQQDSNEPPREARDHNYLPTAQPLYPEEWVPAGRHRLQQQERESESIDNCQMTVDENEGAMSYHDRTAEDREASSHYVIPPPPDLLRINPSLSSNMSFNVDQNAAQDSSTVLPILEIDNVVLFPGSTLPLRLQDAHWIEYLGNLIDDARGLYGSHTNESSAINPSEVRIGILPRIRRRTRRRPHDSGARTGRWRVDLIRRGVASVRRSRAARAGELQARSGAQHDNTQNEAEHQQEDDTSTATSHQETNSIHEEGGDDLMFHANPSRVQTVQYDDPFIGRIGTTATIIFTHEEAANEFPSENNRTGRQSSMVWRRRTSELVVTAIGTSRFRIVQSLRNANSSAPGQPQRIVPLYEVEDIADDNLSFPQQLIQSPGDLKSPMFTPMHMRANDAESDIQNIDEGDANQCLPFSKVSEGNVIYLSYRSGIDSVAYRAIWPWRISHSICTILEKTQSFQGIYSSLPTAAGVQTMNHDDSTYIRVIDPYGFANWLSSNLPLDQNDRLDILEMQHVVQQLVFLYRKIRGMAQTMLRCSYCGTVIANTSDVFTVGGAEGTTGHYVNEYGIVHQTLTVRHVDPQGIIALGYPETKDSW